MDEALKNCILTTSQMAKVDQLTILELEAAGRGGADLMEEAGLCVVREILNTCSGSCALILCGPGNNGGDGFVVARHLKKMGWGVDVAVFGSKDNLKGDALHMASLWDGEISSLEKVEFGHHDVVVDAIFGTGLVREISGELKEVIEKVNNTEATIVAVDIPSGIEGDTGRRLGTAISADITVTFCRKKPAHLLYPSRENCGKIIVADIGIPDRNVKQVEPENYINNPLLWQNNLPRFSGSFHKYDKGHAVFVSGDHTHTGACRLAASASQRIGAGLVSVSSPADAVSTHGAHLTSIMIRKREQLSEDMQNDKFNCWCIGPAAGVTNETRQETIAILKAGKKTVIDADAITVFADVPEELFNATRKNGSSVLTPHAGEFRRLFPDLNELDKITAAKKAAAISNCVVIYKGADTVIANPDGQIVISEDAPANLATAGSGDVLAGIVCGLMAQNMEFFDAACAGQWIHSQCAREFGEGLIAEDLISMIPRVLKRLK